MWKNGLWKMQKWQEQGIQEIPEGQKPQLLNNCQQLKIDGLRESLR